MTELMTTFVHRDDGQDLIEYSLLCALLALACIVAMQTLSRDMQNLWARIGAAVP